MTKKDKSVNRLMASVLKFQPRWDNGDEVWEFYLPVGRKWHALLARRYRDTYYLGGSSLEDIEADEQGRVDASRFYQDELASAYAEVLSGVHREVVRDPIAYHKKWTRSLPPAFRQGVISRKFVHRLIPDYMRFDKELSKTELREAIRLLKQSGNPSPLKKITTGIYFRYVKAAYLANPKSHPVNSALSGTKRDGRAMYKAWADGRDEGLSELPLNDANAFEKWLHDGSRFGGHPWEIYRGGNSTHISLALVPGPGGKGWEVRLTAFSSTRLAETCRIALAFHKEGLPFVLDHRESYLHRLLAEDNVGILPEGGDLKYGWHRFPKEFHVADCIYFSWLKDEEGRRLRPLSDIKALISWFPMEPLAVRF